LFQFLWFVMEIIQHLHGWCSLYIGKPERIHHTGHKKELWNCFYSFLHREALISKSVVPEVQKVLDKMTKMVNCIKSGPLHSRLFSALCSAMEAAHTQLLLHMETSWLSWGQVLSRLCEVRKELIISFTSKDSESSVGIATGYGLDDQGGGSSSPGRVKNFHFSISPRPALGSTQPPIKWVPGDLSRG
jgi:hypothetical protein